MRRPPRCVAVVARTHWVVGLVMVASAFVLTMLTRQLPGIEFTSKTYLIVSALALMYLLGGTLVWFGAPFGKLLSRLCSLIYLPRPQFGGLLWDMMNSPEFQAHFDRKKSRPNANPENRDR